MCNLGDQYLSPRLHTKTHMSMFKSYFEIVKLTFVTFKITFSYSKNNLIYNFILLNVTFISSKLVLNNFILLNETFISPKLVLNEKTFNKIILKINKMTLTITRLLVIANSLVLTIECFRFSLSQSFVQTNRREENHSIRILPRKGYMNLKAWG